jgi:hypothetical protein
MQCTTNFVTLLFRTKISPAEIKRGQFVEFHVSVALILQGKDKYRMSLVLRQIVLHGRKAYQASSNQELHVSNIHSFSRFLVRAVDFTVHFGLELWSEEETWRKVKINSLC